MSSYSETPAAQPPTEQGNVWLTATLGTGAGAHDVADLILYGGGGRFNKLVCRCGQPIGGAPHTPGYRDGPTSPYARQDILTQHRRRAAGLCVHCGKSSCHCDMR